MVDGSVRSQGIVAHPEVGVVGVLTEVQSKAHGSRIHQLCQLIQDLRDQQNMAVLYWADVDEDKAGAGACWRCREE